MSKPKKHPKVNPVREHRPFTPLGNSFLTGSSLIGNNRRLKSATFSNGVNLIVGMIANKERLFEEVKKYLVRKFGEVDYESPIIDFNFTDYYEKEMGKNLKRRFLSFKNLIAPEGLAGIKLYTNNLEERFSRSADKPSRNINLDPGYITGAKLILATTKDYFHRIYLGKGIYAEITLFFRKGGFESFNWAYPDYKTKEYAEIFNHIRSLYLRKRDGRTHYKSKAILKD